MMINLGKINNLWYHTKMEKSPDGTFLVVSLSREELDSP